MATNRDLLKEAIADAKAVKEMAIANAKAALEEAFTPQLQSMLSAKIHEMEDEDEETIDEVEAEKEDIEESEELELEAILKEMEDDDDSEDVTESEEPVTEADDEEAEEEGEEEDEDAEDEEEALELEDMTTDDLVPFIEDVIRDMIEAGELPAGEGMEDEAMEDEESMEMEDEMVDIEELLSEIDSLEEYDDEEDLDEGMIDEGFMDKVVKFVNRMGASGAVEDLIKDKLPSVVAAAKKTGKLPKDYVPSEEVIKAITLDAKEDGGAGTIIFKDGKVQYQPGSETKGTAQPSTFEEELQREIAERDATIETLKGELNEINLLNAKLLHISRIFRSKNLSESQKLKVLGNFDKATSINEVKLVYETLSDTFKSTTKSPIKESLGSASKMLGSTTTKKPIIEPNEAYKRMVDLAFYNSKH